MKPLKQLCIPRDNVFDPQRRDTVLNLADLLEGRIQRIGQVHDTVYVYNLRYKDSVEDRVHELLSGRLQGIYQLFGQIPDVLEDAWIAVAQGERERAKKIFDALPQAHPFEIKYTQVEPVDWESCRQVLDAGEKRRVLSAGWG